MIVAPKIFSPIKLLPKIMPHISRRRVAINLAFIHMPNGTLKYTGSRIAL